MVSPLVQVLGGPAVAVGADVVGGAVVVGGGAGAVVVGAVVVGGGAGAVFVAGAIVGAVVVGAVVGALVGDAVVVGVGPGIGFRPVGQFGNELSTGAVLIEEAAGCAPIEPALSTHRWPGSYGRPKRL
jgi:hypothetical protein